MEMSQVGVKMTRARAAKTSVAAKKRKVGDEELEFSTSLVQLRSRRRVVVTPENTVSPVTSVNSRRRSSANDPCTRSTCDHVLASCSSSNGSSEVAKERLKFVDLEEIETSTYDFNCTERERREMTPWSIFRTESGELESTARLSETNSGHRSMVERMPSEAELEEFFATAEKDLQKLFTLKYNYDIVKDEPLDGRYEWVPLKP